MPVSQIVGSWTYSGFGNDPSLVGSDSQKVLALFVAGQTFTFASSESEFKGVIDWGRGGLDLTWHDRGG